MMVFCNLFITKTLDEINQQQDKGFYYLPFKYKRVTPYLGITWFNLKIPLVLSPSRLVFIVEWTNDILLSNTQNVISRHSEPAYVTRQSTTR